MAARRRIVVLFVAVLAGAAVWAPRSPVPGADHSPSAASPMPHAAVLQPQARQASTFAARAVWVGTRARDLLLAVVGAAVVVAVAFVWRRMPRRRDVETRLAAAVVTLPRAPPRSSHH